MAAPAITVRDVVKSFGPRRVLDGISLDLLPGKVNFIIGRSGEGKSVLLKILTGLHRPDSGSVLYGDLDFVGARRKDVAERRRRMGMLFQDGALFDSLSVGMNVAFPLWFHGLAGAGESSRLAEALLDELGLANYADLAVSALTSGERKRVALARALIVDPEVVFFDEPTTGLDPLLSAQVDEHIAHVQKKSSATVVVVSHDMAATLSLAHKIVLLHKGRVILSGTPEEFRRSSDEEVVKFLSGGDAGLDADED
jgi:phospholipid/cholesterol/gamma-HCH transport system ATP-binding protein